MNKLFSFLLIVPVFFSCDKPDGCANDPTLTTTYAWTTSMNCNGNQMDIVVTSAGDTLIASANSPAMDNTLDYEIGYVLTGNEISCSYGDGATYDEIDICEMEEFDSPITVMKPAIYLYPETETEINVKVEPKGKFVFTYPDYPYENGWDLTAQSTGELTVDNYTQPFNYLFWEAGVDNPETFTKIESGFVVAREDAAAFLQEKLTHIGLAPQEYNDFIVFWLPKMQESPYTLVHFSTQEYSEYAPLTVTPTPDNVIRVFTVMSPLEKPISIPEQLLEKESRDGFTVVEWGGTYVPNPIIKESI